MVYDGEEDLDIQHDDGNVWAVAGDRRGRKKKRASLRRLKSQSSFKNSPSVSDKIKIFESKSVISDISRESHNNKKGSLTKNYRPPLEKQASININDFRRRLVDGSGAQFSLQEPDVSNNVKIETACFSSPQYTHNRESRKQEDKSKMNMSTGYSGLNSAVDVASIRQRIRAKEEAANVIKRSDGLHSNASQVDKKNHNSTLDKLKRLNSAPVMDLRDNLPEKKIIPFTNDMMHSNSLERKNNDVTRTLIRRMSMDKDTQDRSSEKASPVPFSTPPIPELVVDDVISIDSHQEPEINSKKEFSVKSNVDDSARTSTSSDKRSRKAKNDSFFRKQKVEHEERQLAEQRRLNAMSAEERLKEEMEAAERAQHDQRKSDHYAHLGKAFVVNKEAGGRPLSGGRGPGGRGGGRGGGRIGGRAAKR